MWEIVSNFVAFLENLNFNKFLLFYLLLRIIFKNVVEVSLIIAKLKKLFQKAQKRSNSFYRMEIF